MAERDLKIGITTTADTSGAKQAEDALDKVAEAGRDAGKELGGGAVGGVADQAKRTGRGLEDVATGAAKAEKSTRNMGGAVLEASRAFEDAQYGIRGVLNNIPGLVMMLGGTAGIAGAASVAAVAISILGPRIRDIFGSQDTKKAQEDFNALLEETTKRMQSLNAERGQQSSKDFLDSLTAEEEGILRINEALERNVKLLEARRLAALNADERERELRKAEIDANKVYSEEGKIRAKAAIDDESAKAKALEQIEKINDEYQEAKRLADNETSAAARVSADAEAQLKKRAELEAQENRLLQESRNQSAQMASLPGASAQQQQTFKRFETAAEEARRMAQATDAAGNPEFTAEQIAAKQAEAERLRKEAEEQYKRVEDLSGAEARKSRADGKLAGVRGQLEGLDPEEEIRKRVAEAEEKARKAREDAQLRLDIGKVQAGDIKGEFESGRRLRSIRTEEEVARITESKRRRDLEAATKAEEDAKRQRERDELAAGNRTNEEAGIGRQALSLLPKGVKDKFAREVQRAAAGLQDGDQGKEIEQLTALMERLANAVQVRGTKTEVDLKALAERIKRLEN